MFGEHSDWAAGYRTTDPTIETGACLVIGTVQGLLATAQPTEDSFEVTSALPDGGSIGPARFALKADVLDAAAQSSGFFRYAAGTAAEIISRFPHVRGVALSIGRASLPIQKGLASSAAVCVLTARAFSRVHQLQLSARDEMAIAYAGERRTGSTCGRMDQVCALGRRVGLLRFDGDSMHVSEITPGAQFHLLVVDLCRSKDTRRILADLNRQFPSTRGPVAEAVRRALGRANLEVVERASEAMGCGDAPTLGMLMTEAQKLFDGMVAPASPELVSPRLHEVLAHPAVVDYAYGGKGVGSQGDGAAQFVCRGAAECAELARVLSAEMGVHCLPQSVGPYHGAA